METSRTRLVLAAGLAVALTACSHPSTSPAAPTAAGSAQAPASAARGAVVLTGGGPGGEPAQSVEIVQSSGTKPEGFEASVFSDPRRDEDGIIHATSPVTIEFDACRSRSGDGSPLYFYFDWEFDHRANVWGTGDACLQKHTFKAKPVENAHGDDTFRTNVCVANGDLNRHDPATYVSCREFSVVVPRVESCRGPVDDRFTNLNAPSGVVSGVLGNMTANDCPVETIVSAGGGQDFVNILTVFLNPADGTFTLICAAPGPFSGTFFYGTASGQANVFVSGTCNSAP